MQQQGEAISPVVFEIIRNRLIAITEEMRVALQSVSGSPTVRSYPPRLTRRCWLSQRMGAPSITSSMPPAICTG